MAEPQPVQPVKLLVAILWSHKPTLDEALEKLDERWGEIDFPGEDIPCDLTDYYNEEMGAGIQRRLVAFRKLAPPECIRGGKLVCNNIEMELAGADGRRVNLDIGYLDHNKLVLASMKPAGHNIHLGDGVYADLIARFADGKYQPFEWTYPDFAEGRYDAQLAVIRKAFLAASRSSVV